MAKFNIFDAYWAISVLIFLKPCLRIIVFQPRFSFEGNAFIVE